MDSKQTREKIESVLKLISLESTTFEKAESVLSLLAGTSPRFEKYISQVQKALSALRKIQSGDVIELSAEALPEKTEEEKKRKKALIWFIKSWHDLEREVERVKAEFENNQGNKTTSQQAGSLSKLMVFAKGPFGLLTVAALLIVGGLSLVRGQRTSNNSMAPVLPTPVVEVGETPLSLVKPNLSPTPVVKTNVRAIVYDSKKIALSELVVGIGEECLIDNAPAEHYHAKNHQSAKALDGSVVSDPGGCGFGKVDETAIIEI